MNACKKFEEWKTIKIYTRIYLYLVTTHNERVGKVENIKNIIFQFTLFVWPFNFHIFTEESPSLFLGWHG